MARLKQILLLLLATASLELRAQDIAEVAALQTAPASGGGGGGDYSLLASVSATADGSVATTAAIDTTGAKLITVEIHHYADNAQAVTDSEGNTYTALTKRGSGNYFTKLFYCISPTTSATHTFTVTGDQYEVIGVQAWSHPGTPVFDSESGSNAGSGTTIQPGSISPSGSSVLFVGSVTYSVLTADASINSGFTKNYQLGIAGNPGYAAGGYLIQGSSTAQNPTWTISAGPNVTASAMAVFK
jgi:hypothetical protein